MSKKLLLHSCCGPCSISAVKHLRENFWDPSAFFYNPNIHPEDEYRKRLQAISELCEKVNMPLIIYGGYGMNVFLENLSHLDLKSSILQSHKKASIKEHRCAMCYEIRLEEAARFARDNAYQFFTTTLLYSKHQNHDLIRQIAEEKAKKHHVQFVYVDFREFWEEGQAESREMGLYRQKYCGCIFSKQDRKAAKEKKAAAVS
ncbi:MAG: epoxyqueuosine reductase QueH [Candidatus Margulisiibacteriota bacterium]